MGFDVDTTKASAFRQQKCTLQDFAATFNRIVPTNSLMLSCWSMRYLPMMTCMRYRLYFAHTHDRTVPIDRCESQQIKTQNKGMNEWMAKANGYRYGWIVQSSPVQSSPVQSSPLNPRRQHQNLHSACIAIIFWRECIRIGGTDSRLARLDNCTCWREAIQNWNRNRNRNRNMSSDSDSNCERT